MRPAKHANRQTCKQAGCLRTIRASMPQRKQADMQPRRQAGKHAASDARGNRQDGPWFAGQAQRGKPDPAGHPQSGEPGTGSPAGAGDLVELPRSRGQFQRGRQGQRGAIQAAQGLAWEGLEGAERPSMSMRVASKGLAIGWGEPPRGSHANLETAGEEFA